MQSLLQHERIRAMLLKHEGTVLSLGRTSALEVRSPYAQFDKW